MLQSIPMSFYIPLLVFSLVMILSVSLLMLFGDKRRQITNELSRGSDQPVVYRIPENYGSLSPGEKRLVTIQNLYLNHGRDLKGIADLLEVERAYVQEVLVKYGHLSQRQKTESKSLTHACLTL